MLRYARCSHAGSCLARLCDVLRALENVSQPRHLKELNCALKSLIKELCTARCYMQPTDEETQRNVKAHAKYDPRYLTFEYYFDLMLWNRQVALVEKAVVCREKIRSQLYGSCSWVRARAPSSLRCWPRAWRS